MSASSRVVHHRAMARRNSNASSGGHAPVRVSDGLSSRTRRRSPSSSSSPLPLPVSSSRRRSRTRIDPNSRPSSSSRSWAIASSSAAFVIVADATSAERRIGARFACPEGQASSGRARVRNWPTRQVSAARHVQRPGTEGAGFEPAVDLRPLRFSRLWAFRCNSALEREKRLEGTAEGTGFGRNLGDSLDAVRPRWRAPSTDGG